jgi:hypothetical protein
MSTLLQPKNPEGVEGASKPKLDKSGWTDLQHTQYIIGLWDGIKGHPAKVRELPEWSWVPNDRYLRLRGILSGHPEHDTSAMKARERAWEEEHDRQKFGDAS